MADEDMGENGSGIVIEGMDELRTYLKALQKTFENMDDLTKKIEEELNVEIIESIQTQTNAIDGSRYDPLSTSTQKLTGKRANQALYSRSLSGGYPSVSLSSTGILETNLPYAESHQFGTNPNIPARPFLPINRNGDFTEKFMNKLDEVIDQWFEESIEKYSTL